MEEGPDMQAYLMDKTGQRTVPSVWIRKFSLISLIFLHSDTCALPIISV